MGAFKAAACWMEARVRTIRTLRASSAKRLGGRSRNASAAVRTMREKIFLYMTCSFY
jgi:hypothetical protein